MGASDSFDKLLDDLLEDADEDDITKNDVIKCLSATKNNLWSDRRTATKWTFGGLLYYKLNGWYFTKYLARTTGNLLGYAFRIPLQLVGLDHWIPEMPQFKMPTFTLSPINAPDPDTSNGLLASAKSKIEDTSTTAKCAGGAAAVLGVGALVYYRKSIWEKIKGCFGSTTADDDDDHETAPGDEAGDPVTGTDRSGSTPDQSRGTLMDQNTTIAIVVTVLVLLLGFALCVWRRSRRRYDDSERDVEQGYGRRDGRRG